MLPPQIPACLQEFDGILYSATCWLEEAQSWLNAPCCFPTARNLQNHANSLQVYNNNTHTHTNRHSPPSQTNPTNLLTPTSLHPQTVRGGCGVL